MQKILLEKIRKVRGPFTKELVDGWHKRDLEDIVEYFEKCLKSLFKSLEEKGFYFERVERVCPVEFYNIYMKNNTGKATSQSFDISKHSFFGVRLVSHYIDTETGVRSELKKPLMFLPFTNEHGDIYVRNGLYSLQLVLSERGPSVDGNDIKKIFIRVLGYRFKVRTEYHDYYHVVNVGGGNIKRFPASFKLPSNRFYNPRKDRRIKAEKVPTPPLTWYVFAKYGFDGAMKRFANCEYRIGDTEQLLKECSGEGWHILENEPTQHKKVMTKNPSNDLDPAIAIKVIGSDENSLPKHYALGLLFMMAIFSGKYRLADINKPEYWMLLIGYCSIKAPENEKDDDIFMRQMEEHIISVEEYADTFTIDRYRHSNIPVKDTYELFNHLTINYANIIRTYNPADLLHKELASKEFLLENLIYSANEFKFGIRCKSNITVDIIDNELRSRFKTFGIDKSIRENNTILEQTGTDNPFIDYGLGIIRQTKSTVNRKPGSKKDKFDPSHPGNQIHPSQSVVVSYQYPTNPAPDGTGMLSPRVHLANGKYIAIHESERETYEATKKRLSIGS